MTTASHDQLADSIEDTSVPNVMELKVSLVLENDRNVEKAEAYSQQLEDVRTVEYFALCQIEK